VFRRPPGSPSSSQITSGLASSAAAERRKYSGSPGSFAAAAIRRQWRLRWTAKQTLDVARHPCQAVVPVGFDLGSVLLALTKPWRLTGEKLTREHIRQGNPRF